MRSNNDPSMFVRGRFVCSYYFTYTLMVHFIPYPATPPLWRTQKSIWKKKTQNNLSITRNKKVPSEIRIPVQKSCHTDIFCKFVSVAWTVNMILSSNSSKCNAYGYKRIVLFLQNTIKTTRNLTAELYTTQYDNHLIGTYCKKGGGEAGKGRRDCKFEMLRTTPALHTNTSSKCLPPRFTLKDALKNIPVKLFDKVSLSASCSNRVQSVKSLWYVRENWASTYWLQPF